MFQRWAEAGWRQKLASPYVQIVFGARQTGKSTLLQELIPNPALKLDFSDPGQRSNFLSQPEQLIGICKAMPRTPEPPVIVVDEAQNVPAVFDSVQHLDALLNLSRGLPEFPHGVVAESPHALNSHAMGTMITCLRARTLVTTPVIE